MGKAFSQHFTHQRPSIFASPEEALESIEAAEEVAGDYSSDEENALVMDLSFSTGSI